MSVATGCVLSCGFGCVLRILYIKRSNSSREPKCYCPFKKRVSRVAAHTLKHSLSISWWYRLYNFHAPEKNQRRVCVRLSGKF